ncbi:hypothetical protein [Mycobacterium sp. JS623]|uniref:hypothetical protein n=1 Tax=Mycobacterium sp. JS623 TaxID=212767 RepID=UPI0012F9A4C9|nr:hypothetical protein [Mycobacterium sp. JS623]
MTPINYVGIAGVALAIVGMIIARTTSAIAGLGMMVIGIGVILIGVKMAKEKQSSTGQAEATPGPLEVQPPVTPPPAASDQRAHDAGSHISGLQHQASGPPISTPPESLAHEHLQASDSVHTDSGDFAPFRTGLAGDVGGVPDTTYPKSAGRFETPTTGHVVGSAERTDSNPPRPLQNPLPPPHTLAPKSSETSNATRWALGGVAAAVIIVVTVVLSVVVFGSGGKPPVGQSAQTSPSMPPSEGVAEQPPAVGSGSQCGTVRLPDTDSYKAVTIVSGDINCDEASSVINRYFSDTGLIKTGNTLAAQFNGWGCAMPTATAAEQDGYSVQCRRDSDVIRVAS